MVQASKKSGTQTPSKAKGRSVPILTGAISSGKTSFSAKPGDRVRVVCTDERIEGVWMPSENPSIIVLKLDTGYNIGIDSGRVKAVEVTAPYLPDHAAPEAAAKERPPTKGLPIISILHTGGTIASKVDYNTGGVIYRFSPEELLELFPEVGSIATIRSRLLATMWSDDMRFAHYSILARAVEEELKRGCKGVIITSGTDTMHYTAAALAFILQDLPIPVIILGAQRSSDRGSSDAGMNLICAARFIASTDFAGVAICMHSTSEDTSCAILPATKTRKDHTSRRDAFQPVGCHPIALVEPDPRGASSGVTFLTRDHDRADTSRRLRVKDKMEDKVGLLKIHTNFHPEQIRVFLDHNYKGLILEGTGLGHAPTGAPNLEATPNLENLTALKDLIASGCIVAMTSQALNGRVHMHVYSRGIELRSIGIIPCEDMTPETAFLKLAWLLGNYPPAEAARLMTKDIAGEIEPRSLYDTYPPHADNPYLFSTFETHDEKHEGPASPRGRPPSTGSRGPA